MTALLLPGGDLALWVCIPLTAIATYLTAAPIAAILSAIFPRAVDLNSIGRGSNAHGAAGLLGMLAFVAAAAPGTLLAMLALPLASLDRMSIQRQIKDIGTR